MRNAAYFEVSHEVLAGALKLPKGAKIVRATEQFEKPDTLFVVVEHPDLPATQPGELAAAAASE